MENFKISNISTDNIFRNYNYNFDVCFDCYSVEFCFKNYEHAKFFWRSIVKDLKEIYNLSHLYLVYDKELIRIEFFESFDNSWQKIDPVFDNSIFSKMKDCEVKE